MFGHSIFGQLRSKRYCFVGEFFGMSEQPSGGRIKKVMPKEWYISFHGGEEKSSWNNIHVYSIEGEELRKALNKYSVTSGVKLR